MIIHHPDFSIHFTDYGIMIPSPGPRVRAVIEALSADPALADGAWLVQGALPEIGREDLVRVHDPAYVDELISDDPSGPMVATYELVDASGRPNRHDPRRARRGFTELAAQGLANVAGSYLAMGEALKSGFAMSLGGGMHHAGVKGGRGFCPANDIAVGLKKLLAEKAIETAWVVDVDAHKGDGTAEIFYGDPSVLTLSIHMADGWPLDERPAKGLTPFEAPWVPSDVDLPVPEGGEAGYLEALARGLGLLEALSFGRVPDLAVVVMGSDPFEEDELESARLLRLTAAQMLARDRLVYEFLADRSIPAACLMAGGYGASAHKPFVNFLSWLLPRRPGIKGDDNGHQETA